MSLEEWDALDLDDATLQVLVDSPLRYNLYQLHQCVPSVIASLRGLLAQMLMMSTLQGFLWQLSPTLGRRVTNIAVSLLGLYALADNSAVKNGWMVHLLYFAVCYMLICVFHRISFVGHLCAAFSVGFMSAIQYMMDDAEFTSIRGALMILTMKTISRGYDYSSLEKIDWSDAAAYAFNPATVLFGPFTSFADFSRSRSVEHFSLWSILQRMVPSLGFSLLAVAFLLYSSCAIELLPDEPQLLLDYKTAQSFRFSHDFICYLSLSTALLGGFHSGTAVTEWSRVEWPRSMSEVVVVWNLPMHRFLHKYVYAKTREFGYFPAMLVTFLASSLLHGYNFQLTAVLVSLGFCAYAESALRNKLSRRLNACVKSKACDSTCKHRHKNTHLRTFSINLCFTFINIWHLIYLGMPFDGTGQEYGYSWRHTLGVWGRWYFASHLVAVLTLLLSLVCS